MKGGEKELQFPINREGLCFLYFFCYCFDFLNILFYCNLCFLCVCYSISNNCFRYFNICFYICYGLLFYFLSTSNKFLNKLAYCFGFLFYPLLNSNNIFFKSRLFFLSLYFYFCNIFLYIHDFSPCNSISVYSKTF